jgi:hypothetical protein
MDPDSPFGARKHASQLFTQRDYDIIHIAGILIAVICAAVVSRFPTRMVVFIFFAFAFAPALLFTPYFTPVRAS